MPSRPDEPKMSHSSRKTAKDRGTFSIFDIWNKISPDDKLEKKKIVVPPTARSTRIAKKKTPDSSGGERNRSNPSSGNSFELPSLRLVVIGYINYTFLFVVSWIREFFFGPRENVGLAKEENRTGYASLYSKFELFYVRNVYGRMRDCLNVPICSVPGASTDLIDRDPKTMKMLEPRKTRKCINLGSYNYLGFAETSGPRTDNVVDISSNLGLSACSPRREYGTKDIHCQLEETVATFLGVEAAITFGMGFATNSLNLPGLASKGCLVISDEFNHASLILGLKLSGATIKVFKHNNMDHLEQIIRACIIKSIQDRRPWKKIVIVVEGIYSMEGSIVPLPELIAIKKKYNAYLYLDEAHSIGAIGPHGRGVVDYFGLNAKDVDILMGTFTKSFAGSGGYIAGSKKLIDYLRVNSQASTYAMSMSAPVAEQIIASMRSIMDGEGLERVRQLARNTKYFRKRLRQMGFIVIGHEHSPVVPVMVYIVSKIQTLVIGLRDRGVATVGVGFPATKMTHERLRFCLSSGHTKEMLDQALEAIDEIGDISHIKYAEPVNPSEVIEY